MSQRIAFFDFDGTITTKDTLLEFIKFSKGAFPFYLGFALNSPWLVAYRLKIISNQSAKERMLTWFFRNTPLPAFQEVCDRFSNTMIPALIRPKAQAEIRRLKEEGFSIVVVSASPENWLSSWAASIGATLLSTRLETKASPTTQVPGALPSIQTPGASTPIQTPGASAHAPGAATPIRLTGKILGYNCHGEEKVRRIREAYDLAGFTDIYTYGDTSGDKPMLRLGTRSFYRPFR